MQKKVTKSNRKLGKKYRNKTKHSKLKKVHRKNLKRLRREGKIIG